MFGFGNNRSKAVDEVELYLRSMFAGLFEGEGGIPARVLEDPYVAGFLQVLTTHAVATVHRLRMPDAVTIDDIYEESLELMAPGHAAVARKVLDEVSVPTSPLHAQYLRGRQDGAEHVRTFFTNDGVARNNWHQAFRDHVTRSYL